MAIMNTRKVLFIIGTGHCGSTLINVILGSHSQIFGLNELATLYKIIDAPPDYAPDLCPNCGEHCTFWDERVSMPVLKRYFSRKIPYVNRVVSKWSHWRRSIYDYFFEWTGCDILVDSSKSISWVNRQLHPRSHWQDKSALVLFATRDGRAVVNSYLRKYPEQNVEHMSARWKTQVEAISHFYESLPAAQKIRIAYENLAQDPAGQIAKICEFLEVDYEPDMLSYWKYPHHGIGGNLGIQSLIHKYREQIAGEPETPWMPIVESIHGDHYQRHELSIQLDLRWKDELTARQLQIFQEVAGDTNRPFAHDG